MTSLQSSQMAPPIFPCPGPAGYNTRSIFLWVNSCKSQLPHTDVKWRMGQFTRLIGHGHFRHACKVQWSDHSHHQSLRGSFRRQHTDWPFTQPGCCHLWGWVHVNTLRSWPKPWVNKWSGSIHISKQVSMLPSFPSFHLVSLLSPSSVQRYKWP